MSWKNCCLGEHIEVLSGFAFKADDFNAEGRGLPLVRIRDVIPGETSTYYEGGFEPQFLISDGDILIGMDGEFNRARWKGGSALLNQRVCRVRSRGEFLDERYLFWLLPSALKDIEHRTPFATVKHLSAKDIKDISFPLPPLDEQRRIAGILDQADELRRKRREGLLSLDRLVSVLFRRMFPNGVFEVRPLGELCDLVRGSSPRPQGDSRYFGGPVPRLMIADITRDGMWVTPKIDSLTVEGAKRSRSMFSGSVVMAVSGAVGLPAILSVDACIHDGFVGFRELDRRLTTQFLYHWLSANRLEHRASGTGAIWVNLTTDQVSRFEVPLPPIEQQQAFAAHVTEIDTLRAQHRAHLAGLDALFASLQHRAFRGEC